MEEKTTTEEVVETEETTEETEEEDIGGEEGFDYEEDLEYDEVGNVIIPDDDDGEDAAEANPEEPKEPEEDPRDREIARLRGELEKANKSIKRLDGQAKATLKDLGYDGDDAMEGLAKVSAEASGKDIEAYKKERTEAEQREEFERRLRIAEGERMMAEDLSAIKKEIPGASKYKSPMDFPNFRRFGELRDAGASPVEAFRASHPDDVASGVAAAAKATADSKSHMTSAVPKAAKDTSVSIPKDELESYRDMFPNMSDKELRSLYRRVTKH